MRNLLACLRNHHASAPHLKFELEITCGVNISTRTVQRRFTECSSLAYRPKEKALFTQKMMKKRLAWVKKYVLWTKAQ